MTVVVQRYRVKPLAQQSLKSLPNPPQAMSLSPRKVMMRVPHLMVWSFYGRIATIEQACSTGSPARQQLLQGYVGLAAFEPGATSSAMLCICITLAYPLVWELSISARCLLGAVPPVEKPAVYHGRQATSHRVTTSVCPSQGASMNRMPLELTN
jgi:hypothetical protein